MMRKAKNLLDGPRNEKGLIFAMFIGMVLMVNLFAATVLANENAAYSSDRPDLDHDGVPDELENHSQREMNISMESHWAAISSSQTNGADADSLQFQMENDGKMNIRMQYSGSGTELEMNLEFIRILEFRDSNGNGYYDENDIIVSHYDLEEADFLNISHTTENVPGAAAVEVFRMQTDDGVFELVLRSVSAYTRLEYGLASPSEIKIDININDFPYMEKNTLLALHSRIKSGAETDIQEETLSERNGLAENDESGVQATIGNETGYFSWATNASMDGVIMPVGVSNTVDTEGRNSVYFTYQHGAKISHDPRLGISYELMISPANMAPDLVPYLGGIALGAAVVGLAVYRRMRLH